MALRGFLASGLVLAALAAGGFYYWQHRPLPAGESGSTAARAPAPVTVASATLAQVPVSLTTIGTVEAVATVAIKSRVDGALLEAHFKEGQMVRKGDPLFTIDPRPLEAQLRQAEANLARDNAQLESAQADVGRYADLSKRGFAPTQQYDQARATANALTATVKADNASIDMAKLELEYTDIRAPIDGKTGSLLVNVGNLVKANDTVALLMINQVTPIYVTFSAPQDQLPRIRAEMAKATLRVAVQVPGDPGPAIEGDLIFMNNAVDVATGTIQLKANFENADGRLTPGQFVNVSLTISTLADAVLIPSRAVQSGQNGAYVYVVGPGDTALVRPVTLGVSVGENAVVSSGIKAGEQVVTDGQLRLAPGAKMVIRASAAESG